MYSIYAGDELLYSDVCPLETRKVTSPTLKMGVDEAGSLEFTVSEVNKCYTKLLRMKTIITVKKFNPTLGPNGDEEAIWDGRILREDRDFYKNKKLYVEGALAFLNDSCQPLKEYQNKDLNELVTAILDEHYNAIKKDDSRRLYFGGIGGTFKPPEIEYWSTAYEYTIDAIKNIAEYLECHFVVKKNPENGHNEIWFFKDDCGSSDQSIVFTKNLMDYTENYDLSKLATVILPLCQTDRESADKPINIGTSVDLTTPKSCGDDGWGVFCPLSKGWVQDWVPTPYVTKGRDRIYKGGYFDDDSRYASLHRVIVNNDTLNPIRELIVGDLNPDGSENYDFNQKRLLTNPIPLGDITPTTTQHPVTQPYSAHAYILALEDNADDDGSQPSNVHNRVKDLKAYLYYKPKNDHSADWTIFKPENENIMSGYGLINEDNTWPHVWNDSNTLNKRDTIYLAFEVHEGAGYSQYQVIPPTADYTWAMRLSFGLPENETWDVDAATFLSRVKFAKLYAIAGYEPGVDAGHRGGWIKETGTYKNDYTFTSTSTSYSTTFDSQNILNLKRTTPTEPITGMECYGTPWAFSKWPLAWYNSIVDAWNIYVNSNDTLFTGDVDIRRPAYVIRDTDTASEVDVYRFTREPLENAQLYTCSAFGLNPQGTATTIGPVLNHIAGLNYGWFKYKGKIADKYEPCVAVMEIDRTKFSTYFLTTSNTSSFIPGDKPCVATVWKIKNDPTLEDWIPLTGRDSELETGFEYHLIREDKDQNGNTYPIPVLSMSANRSKADTDDLHADLTPDQDPPLMVLNPEKYIFVSCDEVTKRCFEKEMTLYYNPDDDPGYSSHILLGLYSSDGNIGVTMATDEELYSVIAVGQDPDGIDKSKETPMRHAESEPHTYDTDKKDDVFDDKLGYGTLVPPTEDYILPDLSTFAGLNANGNKPMPNVWESGGYYTDVDHHDAYNTDGADNNGIVRVHPDPNVSSNFKVCAFLVKPSYVDEHGKLCTRSIYISTTMYGKSGMYAIFELCKADGSAAKWTDNWAPSCKCHAIEYGKYINGVTTYNSKKITLPTCKDKDTLLEVFVASYDGDPTIWLHDPELADKVSYLTIGAANNGEIRLYADQINVFTSSLEQGGLDVQNGSVMYPPYYTRVRTRDFIDIKSTGAHALLYSYADGANIKARVFVYGSDEVLKYSTSYESLAPVIFLPNLVTGDKVKVVFVKASLTGISPSDIKYPQLYSLGSEMIANLSQGPLKATQESAENTVINADPSDPNKDYYVSTTNYYIAQTTDPVALYLNPSSIPSTITVDGVVKDVVSSQFYIGIWYQTPSSQDASAIYYNNVTALEDSFGVVTFTPPEVNTRFKAQLHIQLGYMNDEDEIEYEVISITPDSINSIILTQLVKQDYYPPSNAYETYGHIEKRIEFEDAESSQELLERAKKYLRQSQFDEMQLKVKALDMTVMGAQVDNLRIADKINVSSPPHGVYRDFIIRTMSIPFDKPEDTTFELGWDNKDSLSKLIRKEKSKW